MFVVALSPYAARANEKVFRFHMPSEPASLDPARFTSTDASYLFHNVYRGLYVYHREQGLRAEGARSCRFITPRRLRCDLRRDFLWSDGKAVVAEDYVRAFRHLLAPDSRTPGVESLRFVRNALEIHAGRRPAEQLGIRALTSWRLQIDFSAPDPDFLFRLAAPLLAPIRSEVFAEREKADTQLTTGPYQFASWERGKMLRLQANRYYQSPGQNHEKAAPANAKSVARPPVEVLFIDEDETALSLYEQGKLTFLRRLPTVYIDSYRTRPDFMQLPMARFDYVGFGPQLANQPELRRALSLALNYEELRQLYHALGVPGCPSIPEEFMDTVPCIRFDPQAAKNAWAKVPEEQKKRRLLFVFSKLAGDDIKKGAEWMQAQWRKNLGIQVDLEQQEFGVFMARLRQSPPAIFRKGISLDRPTCLSALESFASNEPENFIGLKSPVFDALLSRLKASSNNSVTEKAQRRLCSDGVRQLITANVLIPQGRMYFTILANPAFTGWSLNELNQLDLAGLQIRADSVEK